MATVFLGVGQCGVQASRHLWRLADAEYHADSACPLYSRDGVATAVLVDSEPKVVRTVTNERSAWHLPSIAAADVLWEQAGRGNNWAWGYHGTHRQAMARPGDGWTGVADKGLSAGEVDTARQHLRRRAVDALRRKIEACDRVQSLVTMHSTGGGTGAGLGSRLVEDLRDAFPSLVSIAAAVTPFAGGEAPLQHYNSLLTLAKLQENADAVLLFSNDELMARAARAARERSHAAAAASGDRVTTDDMNCVLAAALAGVVFPIAKQGRNPKRPPLLAPFDAPAFVADICPMPTYKWLGVASAPAFAAMPAAPRTRAAAAAGGAGSAAATARPSSARTAAGKRVSVVRTSWDDAARSVGRFIPKATVDGRPAVRLAGKVIARGVSRGDAAAPPPAATWTVGRATRDARAAAPPRIVDEWAAPLPADLDAALARFVDATQAAPAWASPTPAPIATQLSGGDALRCAGLGRSLTAVTNSTATAAEVAAWTRKARAMFDARAYTHWFTSHGCEEGDFEHAFDVVGGVVEGYAACS
mmetsp:Transcript_20567/g.72655  ORF Transcript_20567/g.72655 Transcript_20567/m.72655 type:complete len:530 (-) Transcript_20567:378-1967(-)